MRSTRHAFPRRLHESKLRAGGREPGTANIAIRGDHVVAVAGHAVKVGASK